MMNGLPPNHQQPPGGGPQSTGVNQQMPPMMMPNGRGPPMSGQPQQMFPGGVQYAPSMPGGAPPPMMPMKQKQPPVPMSQLPPGGGQFAPPPQMMGGGPPPSSQLPPSMMASRPPPGPQQSAQLPPMSSTPGQQQQQQQQFPPGVQNGSGSTGALSAHSSRSATPHQLAVAPPSQGQRLPPTGVTQTPNRLDLHTTNGGNATLTANFTPLKASTPQFGSPVVGGVPPPSQLPPTSSAASANPGQLLNNIQALNQGMQNVNLTNGNYAKPPMSNTGTIGRPPGGPPMSGGSFPPIPPTSQGFPPQNPPPSSTTPGLQQPPSGGPAVNSVPQPPMANRYPPMPPPVSMAQGPGAPQPSQPPSQHPQQPQMPSGGQGIGGQSYQPQGGLPPTMASKYPPMPGQQQPMQNQPPQGAFGANPIAPGQPMQYQSQPIPPQPQGQQMHQYPGQNQQQFQLNANFNNNNNIQRGGLSVTQSGFNKLWGQETVDLMQNRHILPTEPVQPPPIKLNNQFYESVNCSPDVFRCTINKIPETKELLNKSRLPLGVLIHPFRDINKLPVIQCSEIVRCRACRTYINPFVYFVDSMKWKCNLCYRVNELPKEFQYDPITKTYGDVTRRPEVKSSTIEFIASSEYMLRPPPPAIYLFLLDVSSLAVQSGYLDIVCQKISDHLDELPGDARTQVGFVAYNSAVHFYNIAEGFNQPHEITVLDVDDVFLPCPDNLLVNLKECKELIKDLLVQLPKRFADAHDPKSALGAALQAAFKMIGSTGGRVTVFQTCLPNTGPGALQSREDPNNRSSKDVNHLGPATDFYKRLALECSGQQIAVDLFLLNSQYCDIATLAGISKYSGGCMHHIPLFSFTKAQQVDALKGSLERYLTRKIGFEAVMRIRCTRGLAIHTFHGNFFVRSTDLLSLPNVNPDAGFAMQIAHEESLTDLKTVCFQAALLYTSSKGERRIRVHTLCLPVVNSLTDVMMSADAQAICGLLVKMGVDRSLTSTLADAREAFINATVDILCAFKLAQNLPPGVVVAPINLSLLPLYINAIMKHIAFRTGTSTRLDDRAFAMCEMKSLPLGQLIRYIYPDFYNIDCLFENLSGQSSSEGGEKVNGQEEERPDPPRLQLSAEKLDSRSLFLMDTGPHIMIYVGTNVNPHLVQKLFGVEHVGAIPDLCYTLLNNNSPESEALFAFIEYVNEEKPYPATIQIIRDTSSYRAQFTEKFVDDRSDSSLSYYEFLQHLRTQIK